jgi:hypothetical protein
MSARQLFAFFAVVAILAALASPTWSQQVTITTPNRNVQSSFFEQNGVGFGFNLRGSNPNGPGTRVVGLQPNGQFVPGGDIQFRQGSFASAIPPTGNFNPGSVATGGFAVGGRGGEAFFNFAAGQGSTISNTMDAPMVTVMNGMPGQFSSQSQQPFVTGVTPVVGGFGGGFGPMNSLPPGIASGMPARISTLNDRIQRLATGEKPSASRSAESRRMANEEPAGPPTVADQLQAAAGSTAGKAALSVAELQRQRLAAQQAGDGEARQLMERGREAADGGKPGVAKIFYRQAARAATGPLREEIEQRIRELSYPSAPTTGQ